MTEQEPSRPRAQGSRLGAELRRLRKLAGLSGRDMARQIGIGQATVSRIENALSVPSLPEVTAWAVAVGASDRVRDELIALTEAAFTEVDNWRDWMRSGLAAMQVDVQAREANAGTLQNFQPALVPGLLQTAEYARQVFRMVDLYGESDHSAAVATRLNRQEVLYDEARRFQFVITESVLRRRYVPTDVLATQLDRIANVATLTNVDVAVLPDSAELGLIPWNGFDIYSDHTDGQHPFVLIETAHAGITINDPDDVAIYQEQFRLLHEASVSGSSAMALITTIARELTG